AEVLWCDAPDCRRISGVKSDDSAPALSCRSAIINEEGVRSAATSQEVRSGTTIQNIDAVANRNCVFAAAAMDEPTRCAGADVQVLGGDIDILILQFRHRAGV